MRSPEQIAVVARMDIQAGKTRQYRSGIRIYGCLRSDARADRVFDDVECDGPKSFFFQIFSPEYMVIGLFLKLKRLQVAAKMLSKKFDCLALVTVPGDSSEKNVHVVGHETVCGAKQVVPSCAMQQDLTKEGVKERGQPSARAVLDG